MSITEKEALEAGTSWWEKELFMGAPDWEKFDQYPYPKLSVEEQSFIDNEVQQLCSMLDEWKIHHKDKKGLRYMNYRIDDRLKNLETLCCSCHRKEHASDVIRNFA